MTATKHRSHRLINKHTPWWFDTISQASSYLHFKYGVSSASPHHMKIDYCISFEIALVISCSDESCIPNNKPERHRGPIVISISTLRRHAEDVFWFVFICNRTENTWKYLFLYLFHQIKYKTEVHVRWKGQMENMLLKTDSYGYTFKLYGNMI